MAETALVTGGTGYVALEIIRQLLADGDHVNATVRDLNNAAKVGPLSELQGQYPGQLQVFEANLLTPGAFDAAMNGCTVVFHVASAFLLPEQIKDAKRQLIAPAIEGTRNVMETVNRTDSVRRVIMTSTIGAIFGDYADVRLMKNETLSEEYWNTSSTPETYPYHYSKVAAEKEAWRIANAQSRWRLVVINPGLILGPSLTPSSESGSLFLLDEMMKGYFFYGQPDWWMATVDIRDAARAHLVAAKDEKASGRYILAEKDMASLMDMANILRKVHRRPWLLPRFQLPNWMVLTFGPIFGLSRRLMNTHLGIHFKLDNTRSIRELGIVYRPLEETIIDHYRSWQGFRDARKHTISKPASRM